MFMQQNLLNMPAFACVLSLGPCLSAGVSGLGLLPGQSTFPLAGVETELRFDAPAGGVGDDEIAYSVLDYQGRVIDEDFAIVDPTGNVSLILTPPTGFFEIDFGQESPPIGFWSLPEDQQVRPRDPFFSTDVAMTFLVSPERQQGHMAALEHLISEGGLARERFHWRAINPSPEQWQWEAEHAEPLRRMYEKAGVRILDVFGDAPYWLGGDTSVRGAFPQDLLATCEAWRVIAARWRSVWGGLEVWNEPDLRYFSGDQPGDRYVVLLKTVNLALHEAGVAVPVGGGVFSQWRREYIEYTLLNGLLDNCDFVSFHYYGDPLGLEDIVARWRDLLEQYGYGAKPLWLTEAGVAASGPPGSRAAAAEQARVASVMSMQIVESKACGIARHFPFLLADYTERGRRFGFLDSAGTPLRSYAAIAEVARQLDGAEYIGDLSVKQLPPGVRARVFALEEKEDVVVVLYTGNAEVSVPVNVSFPVVMATGIDGRPLPGPAADGSFSIPDGLAYLQVNTRFIQTVLDTGTGALRLWRKAQQASASTPSPVPVILQAGLDPSQIKLTTARGYYVKEDTPRLRVNLWANNLSDVSRTIQLTSPSGVDETLMLEVPPYARTEAWLTVAVDQLPEAEPASDRRWLTLAGTLADGTTLSPVVLAIIPADERGISDRLQAYSYRFDLALSEGYRWDRNANGDVVFHHNDIPWNYEVTFKDTANRWAFPRYQLPQEIDFNRVTGVLLRGRCRDRATVRLMAWDARGVQTHTDHVFMPADNQWHVSYVPFSSFVECAPDGTPLHKLEKISVGMNPEADTNRLEISDLYFVGE
jgi:hypothetical protein